MKNGKKKRGHTKGAKWERILYLSKFFCTFVAELFEMAAYGTRK